MDAMSEAQTGWSDNRLILDKDEEDRAPLELQGHDVDPASPPGSPPELDLDPAPAEIVGDFAGHAEELRDVKDEPVTPPDSQASRGSTVRNRCQPSVDDKKIRAHLRSIAPTAPRRSGRRSRCRRPSRRRRAAPGMTQ